MSKNTEVEQGDKQTDDHGGELETLANALSVDLVWEICETDIAHELLANGWRYAGRVLLKGGTVSTWVTVGGRRERVDARGDVRGSHLSDVEEKGDDEFFFPFGLGRGTNSRSSFCCPLFAFGGVRNKYF